MNKSLKSIKHKMLSAYVRVAYKQNKMKAKKIVTAIYVALLIVTFTYADFIKGNMIALMFEFLFAAGLIVLIATLLAVVQIKRNQDEL
jgi:hypothetical protein